MPEKSIEAANVLISFAVGCVTLLWGILTKRVIDIGKEFRNTEDCRNTHALLADAVAAIRLELREDRKFYSEKMETGLTRIHNRLDGSVGQNREDRNG